MQWYSIHVHHHRRDLDPLLLDGVRPFLTEVAGLSSQVGDAYFVRHWRQGPHVRVNVRTDAQTFASVVYPTAERVIGGYLAAHTASATLDPHRLLPLHRRLAEVERETGPLLPWHPDNSLHQAPYDDRREVWGSAMAADLAANFLTETTPVTFTMLEVARQGAGRLALAFDLMIAVCHRSSGTGIQHGYVSLRSHAEAFLHNDPDGRGRRVAWDDQYHRHSPAMLQRIRDVIQAVDGDGGAVPFVAHWAGTVAGFQERAYHLLGSGDISLKPLPAPSESLVARLSPFHRATVENGAWDRLRQSRSFAAYRLALNWNYLQLTRLGLTPLERFRLCHLAANAVEESLGEVASPKRNHS